MYKTPTDITDIKIMGVTVQVTIDHYRLDVEDECDGLYANKVIYLRKEYLSALEYKRVFSHECIHALCDILGTQLDSTAEEVLANTISYMYMSHFM